MMLCQPIQELDNVVLRDARKDPLGKSLAGFNLIIFYDVLHEALNPAQVLEEARAALADDGVLLIGDMATKGGIRENLKLLPAPMSKMMWSYSICLSMACSMAKEGGAREMNKQEAQQDEPGEKGAGNWFVKPLGFNCPTILGNLVTSSLLSTI